MGDTDTKKATKPKSGLDEDTLSYFKRVENILTEDDFEDQESRAVFVENVFTQVEGKELELSCDQAMSRILERLLEHFTEAQMKTLWINLSPNYKTITNDKFGSHVVQNLVNSVPNAIRTERSRIKEVSKQEQDCASNSMEELFLSYCEFIGDDLDELVGSTYSSHVVRAVFEVLGGVRVAASVQRSRTSKGVREKTYGLGAQKKFGRMKEVGQAFGGTQAISASQTMAVPESFAPVLKSLTVSVLEMDLAKLVFHPLSNPVLQTLLLVLHKKDEQLCMKLCKKIMKQTEMIDKKKKMSEEKEKENSDENEDNKTNSYHVPPMLSHEVASHLVEKILHVATPKLHRKLHKTFFKDHLDILAQHPVCNYLVQHLLASATDPALGEAILDELLTEIEDILAAGHDGVIARMAETCVRLGIRQEELTTALLEAFHCLGKAERKSCATLILTVTTHDVFYGIEKEKKGEEKGEENEEIKDEIEKEEPPPKLQLESVNFHGAVLMKTVLEFDDAKVFADSLLHLTKEELVIVSCDQMGSHTIEALMRSRTVAEKRKHKLVNKLRGEFAKFACDKHASHVVETCWREIDTKHKECISQELLDAEHQLTKDFYGSKVLKSCGIRNFKRKKEGWSEKQEQAERKREMFDEIINETGKGKRRKKNPDESETTEEKAASKYYAEMAMLGFEGNEKRGEKKKIKVKSPNQERKVEMTDVIDMIFKQETPNGNDSHDVARKRGKSRR